MNDFFNKDINWVPIFIILSILTHYYQKYLEKEQVKGKEKLDIMKRNPENFSEFEKNYHKHMIVGKTETVILSLSWGKYLLFLGAIFIFLRAIGVIPPPS